MKNNFYTLIASIPVIIIWYVLSSIAPHYLLPYPHEVGFALINLFLNKDLLENLIISLFRVFIGFLTGTALGILLGIAILISGILKKLFYPIISFIIVIPTFVFIPLLMVWIGLNDFLPISAVIICTSFPLIHSLTSASKSISQEMIDDAIISGADNMELIRKIILPLSLSHIAPILRIEAGHSWRIVFVTEFLALPNGLGALMMRSYSLLKIDEMLALVILIGFLALVYQLIIEKIESIFLRKWGRNVRL